MLALLSKISTVTDENLSTGFSFILLYTPSSNRLFVLIVHFVIWSVVCDVSFRGIDLFCPLNGTPGSYWIMSHWMSQHDLSSVRFQAL